MTNKNPVKFSLLGLLSVFVFSTNAYAREGSGNWRSDSIAKESMELIQRLKSDFKKRADQVERELGKRPSLDYQYFAGKLSNEQKQFQERFMRGRLSRRESSAHARKFIIDIERVRKPLAEMEKKAFKKWEGDKKERDLKSGKVYGTEISARRLGVILDNSPSMQPFLGPLRAEIAKTFADSYNVEVIGSYVEVPHTFQSDESPTWFYSEPFEGVNPFRPGFHCQRLPVWAQHGGVHSFHQNLKMDNLAAILAMCELMEIDAIYWFCDFDDKLDKKAVELMAKSVLGKKVKLYVHTLKRRPSKELYKLIKDSGGKLIRKKIRVK